MRLGAPELLILFGVVAAFTWFRRDDLGSLARRRPAVEPQPDADPISLPASAQLGRT